MRTNRLLLVSLLLTTSLCHADITFSFDYSNAAEFNHPTLGADRRAALEAAGVAVGALFDHTAVGSLESCHHVAE